MYLLDTNVVSLLDPARGDKDASVVHWIAQNGDRIFLSVITLAEIKTGILRLRRKAVSRRTEILEAMLGDIMSAFADRILPMDKPVALKVADLRDVAYPVTIELADMIIGATADVHGLTVMTRNVRHFAPMGVRVADPFVALPGER